MTTPKNPLTSDVKEIDLTKYFPHDIINYKEIKETKKMNNVPKTFDAKWTGKYPCLCGGEWIIKYDGQRLELPDDLKYNHMNTFGVYEKWYFDENWAEHWEDYCDGLQQAEWIKNNLSWLEPLFQRYEIPATSKNYEMLFSEIEDADFRPGSCGGCI